MTTESFSIVAGETVADIVEAVRSAVPGRRVEVFVRAAERLRVDADDRGRTVAVASERGVAIRVEGSAPGLVGFAATTSLERDALATLARSVADRGAPADVPILEGAIALPDDGAPEPGPRVEDLDLWASDLASRIGAVAGPVLGVGETAVEVASIAEAIATADGRFGRRFRRRAWGVADIVAHGPAGALRRTFVRAAVGARGVPALDGLEGWAGALAARVSHDRGGPSDLPWRLAPAAAGVLVRALAHAVHVGRGHEPFPVGAGWVVEDRPSDVGALAGGAFDDVGSPTRATPLADGRTGTAAIGRPGQAWRPSYRDAPVYRPAHLVVRPAGDPPRRALDVVDLRILPLDDGEWVFEGLARFPDGSGGEVRRRMSPWRAARACRAGEGNAVATSDGVSTPALYLDVGSGSGFSGPE